MLRVVAPERADSSSIVIHPPSFAIDSIEHPAPSRATAIDVAQIDVPPFSVTQGGSYDDLADRPPRHPLRPGPRRRPPLASRGPARSPLLQHPLALLPGGRDLLHRQRPPLPRPDSLPEARRRRGGLSRTGSDAQPRAQALQRRAHRRRAAREGARGGPARNPR